MSYAGKNAHSAGKTIGVLRGTASRANRCYVVAHCGGYPFAENSTKIINLIFETFPKAFLFLIPALVRFLDMPKAKSIIHQIWLREAMGAILKKKVPKRGKSKKGWGISAKISQQFKMCNLLR